MEPPVRVPTLSNWLIGLIVVSTVPVSSGKEMRSFLAGSGNSICRLPAPV
jgi:hypothetical protein